MENITTNECKNYNGKNINGIIIRRHSYASEPIKELDVTKIDTKEQQH